MESAMLALDASLPEALVGRAREVSIGAWGLAVVSVALLVLEHAN